MSRNSPSNKGAEGEEDIDDIDAFGQQVFSLPDREAWHALRRRLSTVERRRRDRSHDRNQRRRPNPPDEPAPPNIFPPSPPPSPPQPVVRPNPGAVAAAEVADDDDDDDSSDGELFPPTGMDVDWRLAPREQVAHHLNNEGHLEVHYQERNPANRLSKHLLENLKTIGALVKGPDGYDAFNAEAFWRYIRSRENNERPNKHAKYLNSLYKDLFRRGGRNVRIEAGPVLYVPQMNTYRLKMFLMFYILYFLSEYMWGGQHRGVSGFQVYARYSTDPLSSSTRYGQIGTFRGDRSIIPWSQILTLFSKACNHFLEVTDTDPSLWYGNEDSGDYIIMDDADNEYVLQLYAVNPITVPRFGSSWNTEVEQAIDKYTHWKGIVSVNNTDNYCFVYMLAIALRMKEDENSFKREKLVEVSKVISECSIRNQDTTSASYQLINRLTRFPDRQIIVSAIERRLPTIYGLTEFREAMQEMEEFFFPAAESKFAVDVYSLDARSCKKIFPAYMSPRELPNSKRLSLLCIVTENHSHFCAITNMVALCKAAGNGRRIFYTCRQCHEAFFSRSLMRHHRCRAGAANGDRDLAKYTWSQKEKSDDPIPGMPDWVCEKCHLVFDSEERYEYHKEHCFMRHKTGNRFVTFPVKDELTGESREHEISEKNIVLYADFECSIDPESGVHSFMSFGLYNPETWNMTIGEKLNDFLLMLDSIANEEGCFNRTVTCFFHNAMNYDANFILKYWLHEKARYKDIIASGNPNDIPIPHYIEWDVKLIMQSSSRLKALSFLFYNKDDDRRCIRIGDTFAFLSLSLEKLVNSTKGSTPEENRAAFPHFYEYFGDNGDLILKKNLFPYRFFTDSSKLETPISEFMHVFQAREENLQYFGEGVTVQQLYENWENFTAVMMRFIDPTDGKARDYHDIYLACDVLQLCDIFSVVRHNLFESHHIDIADYIGMPSATWAAFLCNTPDLHLPLYDDTRYAEFFQAMTRGGVTSAPLRYAKADSDHSILYLDVNGLYPHVMQQYAYPCGKFEWRSLSKDNGETWNDRLIQLFVTFDLQQCGGCFCVDFKLSDEKKREFDQFPLAPEHRILKDEYFDQDGEMYSYLKDWSEANNGEQMKPFVGLVGTSYDKVKYNVHWKLLWWYIIHGVEVTNVHFYIFFEESHYLRPYIRKNIEIRNQRTDELGKTMYKFMGNSVYGKTFESPFNRNTFIIVDNHDKLQGMIQEGNVSSITPIDETYSVLKVEGDEVVLDKPTYIGACVTEYAKLHMYQIFYDKLPAIFGKGNVELVYTDTDSFIVRVKNPEGCHNPQEVLAYINQKDPNFLGKEGGKLKSETGDDFIAEVVALRSKLYAYKTLSGKIGKRAKGTTALAQATQLSWEDYVQALCTLRAVPTNNVQFERKQFGVTTKQVVRQSLSVNDGKRYICEDGIHTHAWGSPDISY